MVSHQYLFEEKSRICRQVNATVTQLSVPDLIKKNQGDNIAFLLNMPHHRSIECVREFLDILAMFKNTVSKNQNV